MVINKNIDVLENTLRRKGNVFNILLRDHTARKNILWATDSYYNAYKVKGYKYNEQIKPELVTGIYGKLIQPRAAKSLEEQRLRTKEKAEVFTPKKTVDNMNKLIDWADNYPVGDYNWQEYVKKLKIEITCGEAPFIVTRYNPTAHSDKKIQINNRVGFLDKKLHQVNKYCSKQKDWVFWAQEAFKASYGYEWQGDNVLIARENLLYTYIDFYEHKFGYKPSTTLQEEIAEIISWNIFQMDGLKYVIPMSCKHINKVIPGENTLFGVTEDKVELDECEGCKFNRPTKHNGKYVKIMDWQTGKPIKFINLIDETWSAEI